MKNNGQTTEDNRDSGVLSSPLSFFRSGRYDWPGAGLSNRGSYGFYWLPRSSTTTNSNGLGFGNASLLSQNYDSRGFGFAVRSTAPPTPQTEKIVSLSALNSSFHV